MITVGVCTSAKEHNVKALLSKLSPTSNTLVKYVHLPYNDLDKFRLKRGLDGIILCHSIDNRRFAITDVLDALYNRFLCHAKSVLGKENVAVIAHDFEWPLRSDHSKSKLVKSSPEDHDMQKRDRMNAFRTRQPKTFSYSSLAIICGKLQGTTMQMDKEDWLKLQDFVANIHVRPVKPPKNMELSYREQQAVLTFCICVLVFHQVLYLLRTSLKISKWFLGFILYGPDSGTLFRLVLVLVLVPYLFRLWISVGWRQKLGIPRHWAMNVGPPLLSRVPWWQIPYSFWIYYIRILFGYVQNLIKPKQPVRAGVFRNR